MQSQLFQDRKPFQSTDPELVVDTRVEMVQKKLQSDFEVIKQQAAKLNLTPEEQLKLNLLDAQNIHLDRNRGNQAHTMDKLERLAKNYTEVYERLQKTHEMETLDNKSKQVGLGRTTHKTYNLMRQNMLVGPQRY